ncbi:MAG: IMP dehydrogenase [Candidatus Moranbacteria bacterium]|nr:IMP dehydrogenase [Candidatus Moranbacteria bacterium]
MRKGIESKDILMSAQVLEHRYWEWVLGREVGPGYPLPAYALSDVTIMPWHSTISPYEPVLDVNAGPVRLKVPFLSAPMDTVTGEVLAAAMSDFGGCGIIYRSRKADEQLAWVEHALRHKTCLVEKPICLKRDDTVSEAQMILDTKGFSTIPIVGDDGKLDGIVFTRDVNFRWHMDEPVSKWMMPVKRLKKVDTRTSFLKIQKRLRNEQQCSVLPVVDDEGRLAGIYFMKDVVDADPSAHGGKPTVGMAINEGQEDIARARAGIDLGVSMIVIDSSHGNCIPVIEQVKRLREMVGSKKVCIVAGNVADIDGYLRLSEAGADLVKLGVGPGSICSTSEGTGVGYPMFTLIQKISFAKRTAEGLGYRMAGIVADGSINTPGDVVKALSAGADLVMAGKMFVAASESISYVKFGLKDGKVIYRGMASKEAIKERNAGRYGKGKRAPEGVSGRGEWRGPLRTWFPQTLELVRGGLAHTGSRTISELQKYCIETLGAWALLTPAGREQNAPRV